MGGRHLVRSLVEFLDWYDDLQEAETGILRALRREYVESFLKPASSEAGWGDELQNLMMPVSLNSDGLTLYKSRGWGDLPEQLRKLDETDEALWIEKLVAALNKGKPAKGVGWEGGVGAQGGGGAVVAMVLDPAAPTPPIRH